MLNTVQHRHVAIARLSHPTNLGRTMQDLRFIIIVIAPSRAVRGFSSDQLEADCCNK